MTTNLAKINRSHAIASQFKETGVEREERNGKNTKFKRLSIFRNCLASADWSLCMALVACLSRITSPLRRIFKAIGNLNIELLFCYFDQKYQIKSKWKSKHASSSQSPCCWFLTARTSQCVRFENQESYILLRKIKDNLLYILLTALQYQGQVIGTAAWSRRGKKKARKSPSPTNSESPRREKQRIHRGGKQKAPAAPKPASSPSAQIISLRNRKERHPFKCTGHLC